MALAIQNQLNAVATLQVPDSLKKYNNIQVTSDFKVTEDDVNDIKKTLGDGPFKCVNQNDLMPKDSEAAQKAFNIFLEYAHETSKS